jgi:hypothetical protein
VTLNSQRNTYLRTESKFLSWKPNTTLHFMQTRYSSLCGGTPRKFPVVLHNSKRRLYLSSYSRTQEKSNGYNEKNVVVLRQRKQYLQVFLCYFLRGQFVDMVHCRCILLGMRTLVPSEEVSQRRETASFSKCGHGRGQIALMLRTLLRTLLPLGHWW